MHGARTIALAFVLVTACAAKDAGTTSESFAPVAPSTSTSSPTTTRGPEGTTPPGTTRGTRPKGTTPPDTARDTPLAAFCAQIKQFDEDFQDVDPAVDATGIPPLQAAFGEMTAAAPRAIRPEFERMNGPIQHAQTTADFKALETDTAFNDANERVKEWSIENCGF